MASSSIHSISSLLESLDVTINDNQEDLIPPHLEPCSDASDTSDSSRNAIEGPISTGFSTRQAASKKISETRRPVDGVHGVHAVQKMKRKSRKRSGSSVSFSTIEIRSYPIILGDNPACDDNGPPLTIDWDPINSRKLHVDKYERWLGSKGGHRTSDQLKIAGCFRYRLLKTSGACTRDDEIFNRMTEMDKIRKARRQSNRIYFWQRKIKKMFSWSDQAREQQEADSIDVSGYTRLGRTLKFR